VKLSFGIDPRDEDRIPLEKRKPCKDLKVMPEDLFNERHEIATENLQRGLDIEASDSPKGRGFFKVSLSKFATWALHNELKIPQELAAMAGEENITQINSSTNSKQQARTGEAAQFYFDKASPTYPLELDMALQAWHEVSATEGKSKPKARIRAWLDANAKLSDAAKERIEIVANWDKKGGATRTN